MTYREIYCTAQTPRSADGCYESPDHEGKHRGLDEHGGYEVFYWEDEAPAVPAGGVAVVLTREELGVLVTLLAPVKHFFPVLEAKLGDTKDEL
jgi:hypothetical protein